MRGARSVRGRLLAAVAVLATSFAVAPSAAAGCSTHVAQADGWTRIAAPEFPEGAATMTGYDVADLSTKDLVVTNGTGVATSTDGGCAWVHGDLTADYPLPVPDLEIGDDVEVVGQGISQVRFGPGPRPAVWAIGATDVVTEGLASSQPRVLVSNDRGQTFASVTAGLPPFGRPLSVRGIPGGAVLLYRQALPRVDYGVYVTTQTGTWQPVWTGLPELVDLVVDATSPGSLVNPAVWAWSAAALYRGRLADSEMHPIRSVNGNVSTVDLALAPSTPPTVTVYFRDAAERSISRDGGSTFVAEPAPLDIESASTFQPVPTIRAVSSLEVNVRIESPGRPGGVDFSPQEYDVHDVQFVSAATAAGMPLYAFHGTALFLRWVPYDLQPPPEPPEPRDPVDVRVQQRELALRRAGIRPVDSTVRVRPGETKTIDYTVTLPPDPTPLDVIFMTDSTGSMDDTIASVQYGVQEIVDGLTAKGIDLHFGVADFRDYPTAGDDGRNYPYKLRRATDVVGPALAEALESITTGGGNNSRGQNGGLEAILQAATGSGRRSNWDPDEWFVEPGQHADFRPDAMKVILVATDDEFRHPEEASPFPVPSLDFVQRALVQRDIYLVGLEVDTGSGSASDDMAQLATATGALAPPEGVDCDGDTVADLEAGDPIVCPFDPEAADTLSAAFVAMLDGIEDYADIDLVVRAPDGVASPVGQRHFPEVNVKKASAYPLRVAFTCTPEQAGTTLPVRIAAVTRGRDVVSTGAKVECVAPRPPAPPVPPIVPPPAVVAALVPPPPPPPAPVPQPNPNLNPNAQPHPNPQLHANAGLAAQEDQQFQLALANGQVVATDEELAMTGRDPAGPSVPALAWATAAAMTAAAAYGLRRARRAQEAPAYQRSHR